MTFIFNDQTKKNSHGFYLLNDGGDFERFSANPVMLDGHNFDRLIGRWENLRSEGALLMADSVFDDGTSLGAERKGQVERGFLKGASMGIIVLEAEWRTDAVTQTPELYVTKWELFEGSTTPVPSNAGALTLKLYDAGHQLIKDEDVKLHIDNIVKLSLKDRALLINQTDNNDMNKIELTALAFAALGLADTADGNAISAAIVKMGADQKALADELAALKAAETDRVKLNAQDMALQAVNAGKWPADKKDKLVQMAIDDIEGTASLLASLPGKQTLSGKITPIDNSVIPQERKTWTLHAWVKNDSVGLAKIKAEYPQIYEQIKSVGK